MSKIALLTVLMLMSTSWLLGSTINVPADQPTIQAGINAANNGDTVLVAAGTYKENINFNGKAITVTSASGPSATTINGQQLAPTVEFISGEGSSSVLSGFTITNGFSTFGTLYEGGGIFIEGSSPSILDNVVTANYYCSNGGGIAVEGGGPLIQGNTISNNQSMGCGGAVGGGGVFVGGGSAGTTQIIGNTITGNQCLFDGGGIAMNASGNVLIMNNIITNNTATASGMGGGISMINGSMPSIIQNLIVGNTAGQGGGVYLSVPIGTTGILLLENTIFGNTATSGSAFYPDGFDTAVQVVDNLFIDTSGVNAVYCGDFAGTAAPAFSNNDAYGRSAAGWAGNCANDAGAAGNISLDPMFVGAGFGNYRLQPLSPAIGAGVANSSLPATDLAANARVYEGQYDLGAYEYVGMTSVSISPANLAFPPTEVGTQSNPLTATVTNTGTTALQIPGFLETVSEFTPATTTCLTANGIAPGSSCTITEIFEPDSAGPASGSLFLNWNAPSATIMLTGTGVTGDFSIGIASGASSSATISPGQTASYRLIASSLDGFAGTISLTCTGAPSGATCTPSPSSITLNPTVDGLFTVQASTTAAEFTKLTRTRRNRGGFALLICFPVVAGMLSVGRRRYLRWFALSSLVGIIAFGLVACGGGGGGSGSGGTPAGTYTLTVTGTAGAITHSATLTLTVN